MLRATRPCWGQRALQSISWRIPWAFRFIENTQRKIPDSPQKIGNGWRQYAAGSNEALFDASCLDQRRVGREFIRHPFVELCWSQRHRFDCELLQFLLRGRQLQDLVCDRVEFVD